jgi:hypothetical protein
VYCVHSPIIHVFFFNLFAFSFFLAVLALKERDKKDSKNEAHKGNTVEGKGSILFII